MESVNEVNKKDLPGLVLIYEKYLRRRGARVFT